MKSTLLLLLTFCSLSAVYAQSPEDALRFSWNVPGGTARVQAIGGAMGSLGGDITATFVNPAGLGFYRTGDLVITPSYSLGNTKADYLGRREDTTTRKFALGTSGIVFGGSNGRNRRGAAISIAINQMADFKSNLLYRGLNNKSSYSQVFLEEIRNNNDHDPNVVSSNLDMNTDPRFRPNYVYGTSLAFNTYWIDTVWGTDPNYAFKTRAPIASGLLQQNTVNTTGGITELALGIGAAISDKVLVGGTLGVPFLRLDRESEFVEADATTNTSNNFDYAIYRQRLTTSGIGLNLKGGIIYKPQEYWRLGLAIHSPTIYSLTDENSAEITTNTEGYQNYQTLAQSNEELTGMNARFKYMHVTPMKVIASAAYVLREVEDVTRQRGFLTAEIEYVPYGMSSYFANSENGAADPGTVNYLKALGRAISRAYKGAFNFRAGGELKFTTFMVRAGAAYYGNPYKNIHSEKGSRLNLSGGLGYRNKGFFADATYVYAINKDVDVAYRLENAPYYNADVRNNRNKILLTIGFKI